MMSGENWTPRAAGAELLGLHTGRAHPAIEATPQHSISPTPNVTNKPSRANR
jgi:hypothetical protein